MEAMGEQRMRQESRSTPGEKVPDHARDLQQDRNLEHVCWTAGGVGHQERTDEKAIGSPEPQQSLGCMYRYGTHTLSISFGQPSDHALSEFLVLPVKGMIRVELNGRHMRIPALAGKAAEGCKFRPFDQVVLCAMHEEEGEPNLPNVSIHLRPFGFWPS